MLDLSGHTVVERPFDVKGNTLVVYLHLGYEPREKMLRKIRAAYNGSDRIMAVRTLDQLKDMVFTKETYPLPVIFFEIKLMSDVHSITAELKEMLRGSIQFGGYANVEVFRIF